jgi:hypothetical protein
MSYSQHITTPNRGATCEDIYVSKWSEDGNVCVTFGRTDHQTVVYLEPHIADRLGWALLRANSRQSDMPLDGEPARD